MTNLFKQQSTSPYSFIMSDIEWINVASKSLAYCAQLLQQIQQLKEKFETLQEKVTRLEPLVQQLEKQHGGYDTVHLIACDQMSNKQYALPTLVQKTAIVGVRNLYDYPEALLELQETFKRSLNLPKQECKDVKELCNTFSLLTLQETFFFYAKLV